VAWDVSWEIYQGGGMGGGGHWFRLKASGGLLWQVSASLGRLSFIGLDIWIPCREGGRITISLNYYRESMG
jgi:hypothetical protein